MASLRDWLNRVIPGKSLTGEMAGAQVGGVRQPISGHPADGLTPQRLANILRAAAEGEPEAYFELAEDIEERDLHYAAVMATRSDRWRNCRSRSLPRLTVLITRSTPS